jgi:hypothetical protein
MSYAPKYSYSNSHALVVGISKYLRVSPLVYATNDAVAVADLLKKRYGFPEKNVVVLLDEAATASAIRQAFMSYANKGATAPDDRLVFFFAGHGHTAVGLGRPVGFLVPVDGQPSDRNSLIRWDELTRDAELIEAKHVLFLMDACYGGLALQRNLGETGQARYAKDMLARPARQVLTAGKADQVVSDGNGVRPGHSIFTAYLLEALEGAAATEGGVITANGVMAWVASRVSNDDYSRQSPDYGRIEGDGDLIFNPDAVDIETVQVPPVPTGPVIPPRAPRPFPVRLAVIAAVLVLLAAVAYRVINRPAPPSSRSFRPEAAALLDKIEKHLAAFDAISHHEERRLFYGPVDLSLVNRERDFWRPRAEELRTRIARCDANPATHCGTGLMKDMSSPKAAPKAGFLVRYAAKQYDPQKVFALQETHAVTLIRGDEGYSGPLAVAAAGVWTARDGAGRTCDAISAFLRFSATLPNSDVSFKLTEPQVPGLPGVHLGSVDGYQKFLFGWPPDRTLDVAVEREGSDYTQHGPCPPPTPALMVWQPDDRVFNPEAHKEAVKRVAWLGEALLKAQ